MHANIKVLAVAMIAALVPVAAQPAPILDQQYTAVGETARLIDTTRLVGQSFTVGLDGLLTHVELDLFREPEIGLSTLTLDIRRITNGVIGDVLRSTTLSETEVPLGFNFVSFDFLDLEVDIGDVFLISLLSNLNNNEIFWHFDSAAATYADGSAFLDDGPDLDADRGFRTFVEVDIAAVPEPCTLALFGAALLGLATRRRKARA